MHIHRTNAGLIRDCDAYKAYNQLDNREKQTLIYLISGQLHELARSFTVRKQVLNLFIYSSRMKVPLLSRCFMSTPLIFFDDAESPTGESATTMVIGCEVGSSTSVAMHKRNVFVQWRQKIFRAERDNTLAARQALGLDNAKFLESKNVGNSASMKSSIDIDCKGLRCKTSSTQSLPPAAMNSTCNRINTKRTDSSSFPPTSTARRRLCSVDSSSSAMDESCSGHSILDELLMEVYKDPYEDFLHKLKSSKKMQGKIDDIEVDVLTQLPAIKSNLPPKRMRSRRNQIHHSGPSTRAILSSRSNTCQDPKAGMGKCDVESAKSSLQNKLQKNGKLLSSLIAATVFVSLA